MPFLLIDFPVFNPIALSLGPIVIRWYALAYIVGIVLGWLYARSLIKKERLWGGPAPITLPQLDDFILWVTIGIIVGGRTGYVLFYNLPFFIAHPSEILELWKGGMSFHGGFAGCIAAVVLFALKNKIPVLSLGDITCAVGPIGLFLGRLANFINGELWGRPTDLPWGVTGFPGAPDGYARHPSQIYEALLEGLLLFVILRIATHRQLWLQRRGVVAGVFLAGYGLFRLMLEGVREPDSQMFDFLRGYVTMGMLLSLPMLIGGAWLIWRGLKEPVTIVSPEKAGA